MPETCRFPNTAIRRDKSAAKNYSARAERARYERGRRQEKAFVIGAARTTQISSVDKFESAIPKKEGRDISLDAGRGLPLTVVNPEIFKSSQLAMAFQQAHKHGVSLPKILALALDLIGPFRAVKEIVAQPPDDQQ